TGNATYQLPLGEGRFLLGSAPRWLQNAIGGWQVGGIFNFLTGAPLTLTTMRNTITGQRRANPDLVRKIPSDFGKINKVANGVMYFDGYKQIPDPSFSCNGCSATFTTSYSNKAITDRNDNIILLNAGPGQAGTLGYTTLRGPKAMYFDMNL